MHFLLILLIFTSSGALAQIRTVSGLSIPQQGSSTPLNAALYAPDPLVWDAPYPLVSMLPGGGADIISVEWAAQRLAADGYMVIITKPQFGSSTASYNTAAKSGIDFLLSVGNPFLSEADVSRIGACGWSLGGRSLALTQAEDTRLSCIVAWDNLAVSENGDAGSPSGGGTGTPVRIPRVPALGQASEMPGVDAQSKITAWKHWRAHGVPSAQIVFAVGSGLGAHLKWGTSGTTAEHERFHHYTLAWFDRWLRDDRMGTERLLVDTLAGVSAASYLSSTYVGAIYVDSYDCEDLRGLVIAGGNPRSFAPSVAEPEIASFNSPHYAYRHLAVLPRNRLFLFLPGTGAEPANYRQILRCAANHGFHALGLSYVNSPSVAELTSSQPPDTAGKVRHEILDGTDRTPLDAHGLPLLRPFWSHLLLSNGLVPATNLVDGELTIPTTEGVRYQLEVSTNLMQWTRIGAPVTGDGNLWIQPVGPLGFRHILALEGILVSRIIVGLKKTPKTGSGDSPESIGFLDEPDGCYGRGGFAVCVLISRIRVID